MKPLLSVVMITKNAGDLIEKSIASIKNLASEIIVVDDYSTDHTLKVTGRHKAKVFLRHEDDYGKQKNYGVSQANGRWILILDSDEIVTDPLKKEIRKILRLEIKKRQHVAFYIPYQNHFLGRPLRYGGENYKMLRLFKKKYAFVNPALVHEGVKIKKGEIGVLNHKILHYSYRSIWQMYKKFTDYAIREAKQKVKKGEKTGLKKILLYPPHMFWARFFKDRGYRDGLFRIPLDFGFAYMEFLTYIAMPFMK